MDKQYLERVRDVFFVLLFYEFYDIRMFAI